MRALTLHQPYAARQQAPWGDFRCGRYGWLLDDIRPVEPPAPAHGRQQLWEWTP